MWVEDYVSDVYDSVEDYVDDAFEGFPASP